MKIMGKITKKIESVVAAFPPLIVLYGLYYKRIVEREIALGKIADDDKVLCIGGGPLPCTALEIAKRTGAKVYVIDNDPVAVRKACCVIAKLGMSRQICVSQGDGQEIDVKGFSVVHVALQAEPHDKILRNVWSKAATGCRILLRCPLNCLSNLYDGLPQKFAEQRFKSTEQENCTMKSTLLFVKGWERKRIEKKNIIVDRPLNCNYTTLIS